MIATLLVSACARPAAGDSRAEPDSTVVATPGASSVVCPTSDSAVFAGTELADLDGWYGKQLRALGERGFCAREGPQTERYRFTWIPSFHPAVVVRAERGATGARLVAKILTGAGGYEPGSLQRDTTVVLSETEWIELTRLVDATRLWMVPQAEPASDMVGLDGSQWILEGARMGRYNVADRWSPRREGHYAQHRAVGEWLLLRSGLVSADLVKEY